MNVIVTGASGLLGRAVVAEFKRNSWKVLGLAHTRVRDDLVQIDLTDNNAVSSIVREFKPHAIVHCAAERSPDRIQCNPKRYNALNVVVPEELAKLADEVKAVFVFISTDYVFCGENPPYGEGDMIEPVNAYGMSKAKAENAVIRANPVRKVGLSEKLLKKYFGPYQVVRKLSEVTYEVQDFDPLTKRRKIKDIVHVVRMKPYYNPDMQKDCLEDSPKIIQDTNPPRAEPESTSPEEK
ncbi:Methionine adenosyltransferase 2 subunit beta [Araneus ventricosus]|uniref:Methionine adenosyltransferase 2 subunit beta n=1 Tax=Araneus ventricosus TaxID=182803 RepID=A0A4Y2ELA4_ARAVE|nr:Methionine adenosyltransferase 2 subunit beta [Araneus ventricosus]